MKCITITARTTIIYLLAITMVLQPGVIYAANGKTCSGGSGWSSSGSASTDSACGLCTNPGTETQTRTLGSCATLCNANCETSSYVISRSKTSSSEQVGANQQAICQQQYDNDLSDLDALLASCIFLGAGECALGCAVFTVAWPVCMAACSSGITVACTAAYSYDRSSLQCTLSDCKWDCTVTGWTNGSSASGCL